MQYTIIFTAPFDLPYYFSIVSQKWFRDSLFRPDMGCKWGIGSEGIIFNLPPSTSSSHRISCFASTPFFTDYPTNSSKRNKTISLYDDKIQVFSSNSLNLNPQLEKEASLVPFNSLLHLSHLKNFQDPKVQILDNSTEVIICIKNGCGFLQVELFRFGVRENEAESKKLLFNIDFESIGLQMIPEEYKGKNIGRIDDNTIDVLICVNSFSKYGYGNAVDKILLTMKNALEKYRSQLDEKKSKKTERKIYRKSLKGIGIAIDRIAGALNSVLGMDSKNSILEQESNILISVLFP